MPKRKRSSTPWQHTTHRWLTTTSHQPCDLAGHSGVYETLRVYGGEVFALATHLERLRASLRTLGLRVPRPFAALRTAVLDAAIQCQAVDATIRITVWDVASRRGGSPWAVMVRPLVARPKRWFTHGVAVATTPQYRSPRSVISPQTKHADLVPGVLVIQQRAPRIAEDIYRLDEGAVGEGTISNVCMVTRDRELLSAPPSTGVLPGVMCRTAMDVAPRVGLRPVWRLFTRHEAWNAAELLLTNSLFEILPITTYDGRRIGTGQPGTTTRRLHRAVQAHIHASITGAS